MSFLDRWSLHFCMCATWISVMFHYCNVMGNLLSLPRLLQGEASLLCAHHYVNVKTAFFLFFFHSYSPVCQAHHCGAFNQITCICLLQYISHSHHVLYLFSMLLDIVRIIIQIYIYIKHTWGTHPCSQLFFTLNKSPWYDLRSWMGVKYQLSIYLPC